MKTIYAEPEELSAVLGIPVGTLYGVANQLNRHYHTVLIGKADGTKRSLSVPDALLKTIQRRILVKLLSRIPVSPYATAYHKGSGTLQNALPHTGKHCLLKLDIHDFFGSIHYSAVKDNAFPAEIYSEPLRILLSMLCYRQDALPQGAPTSPAISNCILYDFDMQIGKLCQEKGIVYTRYCDDLTFSGDFDSAEMIQTVTAALLKNGFHVNAKKTRVCDSDHRQSVTGLIVNHGVSVPADYRRQLRREMYYLIKFGAAEHISRIGSQETVSACLQRLNGEVNYVLSVMPDNREALSYRARLTEQLQLCREEI